MSRIRVLPDNVANQIAAGEVVERPVAVVKELVENSLDAGATRVDVHIARGGKTLIRVEDNGSGMSSDDAMLSLERHATSKIRETDDLDTVMTLGFRGEAVPSIASVSRFTMQTRREGDGCGTEILLNGGKLLHCKECGMPAGTVIEAAHLFNSVPARRKFLKTDKTETAHIVQLVKQYALCYPGVAFSLKDEGRLLARSPASSSFSERIASLWSRSLDGMLMDVDAKDSLGMRLRGAILQPGAQGRNNRHDMQFFVNNRPVDSRTLSYAVIEAYHSCLPRGKYPAAFLFLDIDPRNIDVNVHPAKRELRFRNEAEVRRYVMEYMLKVLEGDSVARVERMSASVAPTFNPSIKRAVDRIKLSAPADKNITPNVETAAKAVPAVPVNVFERPRIDWSFFGFVRKPRLIALFHSPNGIFAMNCRAARERICFERMRYSEQEAMSQKLLLPITLELDAATSDALDACLPYLNGNGFQLGAFGRHFYRIEELPEWMNPDEAADYITKLASEAGEGRMDLQNHKAFHDKAAEMAVILALNEDLPVDEGSARQLLTDLMLCKKPLFCPRGRPTCFEIETNELIKRFGLSGSVEAH